MIIKSFYFRDFFNEHARIKYIRVNDSVDFRKILSFGFYLRPASDAQNQNPYGINGNLNTHNWAAGWHFGVNYRIRCQIAEIIFPINVAYANLVAPDFMAMSNDWKVIPHYFGAPADQGVDFFKSLNVNITLLGEFHDEFEYWKHQQIGALGGAIINPQIGVYQPADLSIAIAKAKELL